VGVPTAGARDRRGDLKEGRVIVVARRQNSEAGAVQSPTIFEPDRLKAVTKVYGSGDAAVHALAGAI
jgi:hypothetical protein